MGLTVTKCGLLEVALNNIQVSCPGLGVSGLISVVSRPVPGECGCMCVGLRLIC